MLALIVATPLVFALQAGPASVAGVVRRSDTGAAVAGAIVSVAQLERTARASADGRYLLPDIPAGPWHLTIRAIGYAPRTLHALVPRAGRLELDMTLVPVPYRLATVQIRPAIARRGSDAGGPVEFPDRSVTIGAVAAHPQLKAVRERGMPYCAGPEGNLHSVVQRQWWR